MKAIHLSLAVVLAIIIATTTSRAGERPRLVVVIAIDQMRGDHLTRYASLYSHGFKRLTTEGVHYLTADLNYAGTATGPGHATLGTGTYPWKSGIVANNFVERSTGKKVYCVADSTAGPVDGLGGKMSPRNLLSPGFTDWVKAASPGSRVVSLSYKDRAAVLMGGKRPDAAYWFDRTAGRMGSSSYYMPSLPAWVHTFNASGWIETHLPGSWTKLLPDSVYERFGPDDMAGEPLWLGTRTFPHAIETDKRIGRLFSTPWGNDYLLDFAKATIEGERLGTREAVDLMWISLSTTDDIGSEFGPSSHEMIDNLVRIDRALGDFLAYLEKRFGRGGVTVALSGDHGVMQMPEYLVRFEGVHARRIDNEDQISAAVKQVDSSLRRDFGVAERIVRSGFIHEHLIGSDNARIGIVEQRLRGALLTIDGVADVYFKRELMDPTTPVRPYLEAFRHSFLEARSPDYLLRECEYCLVGEDTTGSSHGSPYTYDRVVPLVFWGTGRPAARVTRTVHTVDLTVTLARRLGVPTPSTVDGVALEEVLD